MKEKKRIKIIPVLLFIVITPLVVRIKILEFPIKNFLWSNYPPIYADLFTYYKGIVIITSAVIACFILLKKLLIEKKKITFDKYKKMILISSLFVLIVTFLSEYKFIATKGDITRAEGVYVLISYFIMTLYIGEVVKEKKEMKVILYSIYVVGAILGLIGLFQFIGKDIFETSFFQKLYLAEGITKENLNFKMRSRVFMTLFNPNYVGSIAALVYTFSLNMIIRRKKIIEKISWLALIILMFIALAGSLSQAGFIGVFIGSLATLVINYKLIIFNKKKSLLFFVIFLIILGGGYKRYYDHRYIRVIRGTFTRMNKKVETPLKSMTTESNRILFNYDNENYEFVLDNKNPERKFTLYRKDELIDININAGNSEILIEDDISKNIKISFYNEIGKKGYKIIFDNRAFHFLIDNNQILYRNHIRKLVNLEPVEYVKAFEGYEHLGSGRFYIWSRSIPLLKKTWLLGFGPDHFAYNFPQTDYVGKNMENMTMVNMVVDKPHNMYLQYAINIGIVPLLILLAFWGMLLFELFKIVQKEELDDIYLTVAAAAFSSIIGFMAVGMFNDSTVNVSSVFWGIVGLGLAVVNYNRYDHVRFKEEN